jgi:hypothetical protein
MPGDFSASHLPCGAIDLATDDGASALAGRRRLHPTNFAAGPQHDCAPRPTILRALAPALWIGYLASGGGPAISFGDFMVHPRLTDAGIYILLWMQHAGLWLAFFYLLSGITVSLTVRTTLAIFCASQPVFYAFAHCVGSETLSMIGIVFLVGTGLRIIHSYPKVPVRYWVVAGVILCCCILTRHINSVLVALLPLVIATIELRRFLKVKTQQDVGAPPFEFAQHMRPLVTSVVIGLAALLLANQLTGILARAAHIGWRSEVGFTFIWRLDFLQSMPAADRHQLLETIAARTSMPESRVFLRFLEAWEDRHPSWDPRDFAASARAASRLIGTKGFGARFHRSLNEVATAFLRPPPASLVSAAWNDFANATRFTQGAIARYLFAATEYVSKHPEVTPQSRGLSTFRDASESFMRFQTAPYFSLWDFLSIQGWLLTWLGLAGARPLLLKRNNSSRSPIVVYASGMIVIGILMTFLNCFFAQIQPRFALPMMELVLLPFIIVLGLLLTESAQSFRRNVR